MAEKTMKEVRESAKALGINSFGKSKATLIKEIKQSAKKSKKPVKDKPIKKQVKVKKVEPKKDFQVKSPEDIQKLLLRTPSIEVRKVRTDIVADDAHFIRANPIPRTIKENLSSKYKEKFITYNQVTQFISMGYTPTELNENSGFSLPDDVRHIYIKDAKRGVLLYMIKEI